MSIDNYEPGQLTRESVAAMIDHTFLAPYGEAEKIDQVCFEAIEYGFATVAVNPAEVRRCAKLLADSPVGVCTAISFPLGQNTSRIKLAEIEEAIENGASEVDMVINIRALQAGNCELMANEISAMVRACQPTSIISKVILETCYLTDEQKLAVCQMAVDAGVDFVKTSTGFGTAGATVDDVRLLAEAVGPNVQVKASGSVRDLATAKKMIEAGATRIGTSSGIKIIEQL
jgi:deoxyribose-phosphate aldolase